MESPARLTSSSSANRWAWLVAFATMLLTLVPYLMGASFANGRRFLWLGYNLDDSCVYLSWMRQAADGSLRAYNLFTTEPQHGMALNPLFLVLGKFAGLTGLPLIGVYHGARMLSGFALLLVVWRFLTLAVAEIRARKLSFLFVCFASGLGWLPFWWDAAPLATPIDKWQPEAITFLSLYLSPLFCFSMLLQVTILMLLWQGERTQSLKYALSAGACGALLGLVHTYDVISLAIIWIAYLLIAGLTGRFQTDSENDRFVGLAPGWWQRTLVAGTMTAPAVLYIAHELQTETVFRARANVETLSPSLAWVVLGYGLTLALAVWGAKALLDGRNAPIVDAVSVGDTGSIPAWVTGTEVRWLLLAWSISNVAASYLPVAFQRKMLQGTHFPLAILAGIGATALLNGRGGKKPIVSFGLACLLLTLLLSLTNLRFMARDIGNYRDNLAETKRHRTYLKPGEVEALRWLHDHTPTDAAVQPLPYLYLDTSQPGHIRVAPTELTVASFTPALAHRAVYCGHWGETPDFGGKLNEITHLAYALPNELTTFAVPHITEEARLDLLRKMRVRYLLFSQKEESDQSANLLAPMFRGGIPLPNYLVKVYTNPDADIYEFQDPSGRP